jgi:hypothetical protein
MKKYRSERKGRRSFDTAIEYGTVAVVASEKTRTAKAAVRARHRAGVQREGAVHSSESGEGGAGAPPGRLAVIERP